MKIFSTFIVIIFAFLTSNAQMVSNTDTLFGNEWIDFNNQYFKISIAEDGIYHITSRQLSDSGEDINNIKGTNFKLIAYGQEVPIYTSTDDIFGENDYIEFYGEKNKVQLDSFLFRNKDYILNPEYSLFTDTSSYFLTWNNSGQNKRLAKLDNDLSGNLPPVEEYYFHDEKLVINSDFNKPLRDSKNHVYRSNFDIGEGFASPLQQINNFTIKTSDVYNAGVKPSLTIRLTTNAGNHNIDVLVNGKVLETSVEYGFICKNYEIPLSFDDLTSEMNISVQGKDNSDIYDRNAVSVIDVKYSRSFNFNDKPFFKFKIEPENFSKYIEINHFDLEGNNFVIYDLNNNSRLVPEIDRDKKVLKFILPPSNKTRDLFVVNLDKSVLSPTKIESIKFENFLQYKDRNYIIVTDKDAFIDDNGTNWVTEY
ncbi:MAG TPA: hypothetical protein ENK66_04640, partial [Arcobacter sp.]|nr:hypothetical protein [Arcobacter sp.]